MLKLVDVVLLALVLVALCSAQIRPVISNTFSSSGDYECTDSRGTFSGQFILDRDETKNMGVENGTYKSGDLTRHYEKLDLYNSGLQYIVRDDGKGNVSCQLKKLVGDLPQFWYWLSWARFIENETVNHTLYNFWEFESASSLF